MNDLFDTSKKPIPIEAFDFKTPELILAPDGRDYRGRPVKLYITDSIDVGYGIGLFRVNIKPEGKPFDEAFEVTNVVWERTIKHISHNKYMNGQLQDVVFFSGIGEREFIKNNKGSFIFL